MCIIFFSDSQNSVDILLQRGADAKAVGNLAMTRQTRSEIYRTLGGYGGMGDCFPLYTAALKGHSSVVRQLIKKGADVNQVTSGGQTALHAVCFLGELQGIFSNTHSSVLYEVKDIAMEEFSMIIIQLMGEEVDVNKADNNGRTALHIACQYGNSGLVVFLIDKGADVTIKDNYGYSVLETAAMYDTDTLDILLEHHKWTDDEIINAYEISGDADYMKDATLKREECNYPKKVLEPMEYYKFMKEWESLAEIEQKGYDGEWVWIQSRLARERVFNGRFIHFEIDVTEPGK